MSESTDSGAAMSAKNSKSPSPNRNDHNICLSLEIVDPSKKSPTTANSTKVTSLSTTANISSDTKKSTGVIGTNTAHPTKPRLVKKAASADEMLSSQTNTKQESVELPTILDEVAENQSKNNVQVVTRQGLFTFGGGR